jgi:hypothetical protein
MGDVCVHWLNACYEKFRLLSSQILEPTSDNEGHEQTTTTRRASNQTLDRRASEARDRQLDEELYGPEIDDLELGMEYWG